MERDRPDEEEEIIVTEKMKSVGLNELSLFCHPACSVAEVSGEDLAAVYIAMTAARFPPEKSR